MSKKSETGDKVSNRIFFGLMIAVVAVPIIIVGSSVYKPRTMSASAPKGPATDMESYVQKLRKKCSSSEPVAVARCSSIQFLLDLKD